MGTDIHGVLQIKDHNGWETVQEINRDRNYLLFNILAGVRNKEAQCISIPRGLPEDFIIDNEEHFGIWMGEPQLFTPNFG